LGGRETGKWGLAPNGARGLKNGSFEKAGLSTAENSGGQLHQLGIRELLPKRGERVLEGSRRTSKNKNMAATANHRKRMSHTRKGGLGERINRLGQKDSQKANG